MANLVNPAKSHLYCELILNSILRLFYNDFEQKNRVDVVSNQFSEYKLFTTGQLLLIKT